jgi:uncharacterized protein
MIYEDNLPRSMTMVKDLNTKRILIFLAIAFGIPWATALVIFLSSLMANDPAQAVGLANIFFIATPWLANIAARLFTREGWGNLWLRPNFRRGWRFYLAAWLLPLAAVIVGAAAYYLLFPQSFDANLAQVANLFASVPAMADINPWLMMLFLVVQSAIIAVPINAVASMGEEFGWRAYLLQKLMARFAGSEEAIASVEASNGTTGFPAAAARKAALLVGLIWGIWHWPLFFMSMRIDASTRLLFPLVYLLSACALSVILSWVTLRSGSVWPAAVGHGAINAFTGLAALTLVGPPNSLLGPLTGSLIGSVGVFILALVVYFNRKAFASRSTARLEPAASNPSVI